MFVFLTIITSDNFTFDFIGVSAMGIFWSMVPCKGQMDGIRLMKKDVDTPFRTTVNVHSGHVSREELDGSPPVLCSTVIDRWYRDEGVKKLEVSEGRVRGTLFLPAGILGVIT